MTAPRGERAALTLRAACATDCGLLFTWTNALRVCGLALSGPEPIERPAHDAWFAARLSDPDCRIWIVEHAGAPAGVVRLERETGNTVDAATVSIFIAPEARRLGLASAAIEHALRDSVCERGALTAVARVRSGNAASRRLFDSLGFTPAGQHADHVILHRRVSA